MLAKGKEYFFSHKTPAVLLIVKFLKVLSVIGEIKNLCKREKIHCHLRTEYSIMVNQFVMMTV